MADRRGAARAAVALLSAALLIVAAVTPALAQSLDALAAEMADRGYAVDPGVDVEQASLADGVAQAGRDGFRLMVAVLPADAGEPTVTADALLDRLGDGTVLVVVPDGIGYSSTELTEEELNRAADAALPAFRRDLGSGVEAFGQELGTGAGDAGGGAGDGVARFPLGIGAVLVLGLLAVGAVASFASARSTRRLAASRLEEARAEVRHQIDAMADGILTLTDRVALASEEAKRTFADATAAYSRASDAFPDATTEAQLAQLNDSLDRARWQLEVTEALIDGRPPPAEPADGYPTACFFDPDHGTGVVPAEVRTTAGSREVGVCRRCAALLERGEAPEPRRVEIDGQPVPLPMAPRPYGGSGMRDLGSFTVLAGGAAPVPYRWGWPRPRVGLGRRGGGGWASGGFGGGIGGGGRSFGRASGGRSFGRASGGRGFSRGRGGRSF